MIPSPTTICCPIGGRSAATVVPRLLLNRFPVLDDWSRLRFRRQPTDEKSRDDDEDSVDDDDDDDVDLISRVESTVASVSVSALSI